MTSSGWPHSLAVPTGVYTKQALVVVTPARAAHQVVIRGSIIAVANRGGHAHDHDVVITGGGSASLQAHHYCDFRPPHARRITPRCRARERETFRVDRC
jgi:hypothetical protein